MNPLQNTTQSVRRIAVFLGKEFLHGPRNFLFIMAIVVPLVLTFVIQLLFGSLFTGQPRLGIVDEGDSRLVTAAEAENAIRVNRYPAAAELRQAVAGGAVDLGLVLPPGFDDRVETGETVAVNAYLWGQSLLKNRVILATTLAVLIRETAGQEAPVEIVTTPLGDLQSMPWEERLLPFLVLMAVILGGSMVPATSLVEEKQRRTLSAVTVTPLSIGELYAAKGLLGFLLSLLMGTVILVLNNAFGIHPGLLLLSLALGAVMAVTFGVLLGHFIKDINTLFATIKGIGILLYAPALVYLFPEIPAWIGRLFPTYYMVQPVVEISQQGAGWAEIAPELAILALLDLLLVAIIAFFIYAQRSDRRLLPRPGKTG